ncbi:MULTISPECIES: AsnC family protein [unclassified Chryseobacterium]|uniref:AsnC family protein n=1 Tax=unclassified Chryseobacterium TaxID=2593645 RepID=UPI001157B686|nr:MULTISPECIES: AsnC family protein [unclassified Chryseobacterium]MBO9691320.1 helix-turn-helix domain-containing protein [Chryseobacterium sp.]GEJ43992.1 hypothetical protein CRS_06000 [Chryseobacterium sp. ON_d1]
MKRSSPNYIKIYSDIIQRKFPHKKEECEWFLTKKELSAVDIIELNKRIFGTKDEEVKKMNQKLRSYNKSDILDILTYQKNNKMSNLKVAEHFGLSRNTMTKWKRMFK